MPHSPNFSSVNVNVGLESEQSKQLRRMRKKSFLSFGNSLRIHKRWLVLLLAFVAAAMLQAFSQWEFHEWNPWFQFRVVSNTTVPADAPVAENRENPARESVSVKEVRTCESGKYAVGENGQPCIDLKRALKVGTVYVVDTDEVQYLACTIPKTACTVHLSLMGRIFGEKNYEAGGIAHNSTRKAIKNLAAYNNSEIGRMLANTSLPKYMVVRNPIQRILSGYLSKVEVKMESEQEGIDSFKDWVYKEFPIGTVGNQSWRGINPHWTPQMEFCGMRVREVGSYFTKFHFERPEGFVDFLYKILPEKFLRDGWRKTENLSFREHILTPATRTKHTNEKYKRYFTLELFDYLTKILIEDITTFGYEEEIKKIRDELKNETLENR